MRHVIVDEWSRQDSPVHRRDARVKVIALVVYLVSVTTAPRLTAAFSGYALLLLAGCAAARLPLGGFAARAAAVLPFSATFALISFLAGEAGTAALLLAKSYLAAGAALLLTATTPLPRLMSAIEKMGAPVFLVMVIQFLFRYLFVVVEETAAMLTAARCRAPALRGPLAFRAAAGMLAVLFAKSYQRAEGIHRAMVARGFCGSFPLMAPQRLAPADAVFLAVTCAAPLGLRVAAC